MMSIPTPYFTLVSFQLFTFSFLFLLFIYITLSVCLSLSLCLSVSFSVCLCLSVSLSCFLLKVLVKSNHTTSPSSGLLLMCSDELKCAVMKGCLCSNDPVNLGVNV